MYSSPAEDIAGFLAGAGIGALGGTAQWAIHVGEEPASPPDVLSVYDTGGIEDNADGPFYSPTLQVRVRALSYAAGYDKASTIRDLLIIPTGRQSAQWFYTGFWIISDVAKIGKDDNDRVIFTLNLRLMREPLPTL